jgi:hypothetical protein
MTTIFKAKTLLFVIKKIHHFNNNLCIVAAFFTLSSVLTIKKYYALDFLQVLNKKNKKKTWLDAKNISQIF